MKGFKCPKCNYEFDGQSVCEIYYHECKVLKCPCGCHLKEFSKDEVKLKAVCMSCNCAHPITKYLIDLNDPIYQGDKK